MASAEQSERVALGRYQAGAGTIVETLNAQSALASARQQQIQAAYQWNIARASLTRTLGALDLAFLQNLSQGNEGPPRVSLTPTGGGLGVARPGGHSTASPAAKDRP